MNANEINFVANGLPLMHHRSPHRTHYATARSRLGRHRYHSVDLFRARLLGRAAIWPILLIYWGFTAATDGVGKAWISSLVPPDMQGRGQGLYQGLTGGAVLVAGIWAGLAWGKQGTVPLLISGIAAAALIPLFLLEPTEDVGVA